MMNEPMGVFVSACVYGGGVHNANCGRIGLKYERIVGTVWLYEY